MKLESNGQRGCGIDLAGEASRRAGYHLSGQQLARRQLTLTANVTLHHLVS